MNILFVCTGNVFRSMSAEYCLKDFITREGIQGVSVDSAGTHTSEQAVLTCIKKTLLSHGIDASNHQYKQLKQKHLNWADIIIAMHTDHQELIKKEFGVDANLFNELAIGKNEGIPDVQQYKPEDWWKMNKEERNKFMDHYCPIVVEYIYGATPLIAQKLKLNKK